MVNCEEWHKQCNADCCRFMTITGEGYTIQRKKPIEKTEGFAKYMKLHGATVKRDRVIFDPDKYRIEINGKYKVLWRDCEWLENNLCKHNEQKPNICKSEEQHELLGKRCGYNN